MKDFIIDCQGKPVIFSGNYIGEKNLIPCIYKPKNPKRA